MAISVRKKERETTWVGGIYIERRHPTSSVLFIEAGSQAISPVAIQPANGALAILPMCIGDKGETTVLPCNPILGEVNTQDVTKGPEELLWD